MEFKAIDENNFNDVIKLKVGPDQERFVASVSKSLSECWLYRNANDVFPLALCVDDTVVGFVLLDTDVATGEIMIWRILIDESHQGRGYGKQAVLALLEKVRHDNRYKVLNVNYVLGNSQMASILGSLNFRVIGMDEINNEVEMQYEVPSDACETVSPRFPEIYYEGVSLK